MNNIFPNEKQLETRRTPIIDPKLIFAVPTGEEANNKYQGWGIEGSRSWAILARRLLWGWVGRRPELFGADQAGTTMESDVYWKIEERPNTRLCHNPVPDSPPRIDFLPR
jgi:hypothetical protein